MANGTSQRPSDGTPAPTGRSVAWLIAVACLAAMVPIWGGATYLWLAGLIGWILLASVEWLARPRAEELRVTRELPSRGHVGREGVWTVVVANVGPRAFRIGVTERAPRELGAGAVDVEVTLRPGEDARLEVPFVGLARGRHALAPVGVRVRSALGLLEQRRLIDLDEYLPITPGRPGGEVAWLLARASRIGREGSRPTRDLGAGWEFDSLRDYRVGDELRMLDWKASARCHSPVVRQLELEQGLDVLLALDCGRLMHGEIDRVRKLDLAMTPLLDLAAIVLRQGDRVGLLCFDERPRAFLPPRAGLDQLDRMTEALAELADHDAATSYLRAVTHLEARYRKPSFILVFTDFTDELSASEMTSSVAALARRHRLLFVAVGAPHLERALAAPDDSEAAAFERGIAGGLLVERRRTLEELERLGVATLDAEPRRLSGPLIRRWVELRAAR